MKPIRIGVLGCASIAKRSVIPAILSLPDHFQLICVASRSLKKALEFADQFNCKAIEGYNELLNEDVDAVYIPLPTGLHDEWINRALSLGKHVYAEKSIALSYKSAQNMVNNAIRSDLALMEGYMFQYHPQHSFVKELISDFKIGEIRSFRSSFCFPPLPSGNFRYDNQIGGGALFDAAGYTVRAAHFVIGDDLEVVASSLYKEKVTGTVLYGSAFLKGKNGLGVHLVFGFDNFYQCDYEILGSKGKIIVDKAFTPGAKFKPTVFIEQQGIRKSFSIGECDQFRAAFIEFYSLIFDAKKKNQHYNCILRQSMSLQLIRDLAGN